MAFEDLDFEDDFDDLGDEEALPEESSNRTFIILAGALGGVALLAVICILVYALAIRPQQVDDQAERASAVQTQNAEVEMIIEQTSTSAAITAIAAAATATPTQTKEPTFTPTSTATFTLVPTTAVVAMQTTTAATLDPTSAAETSMFESADATATAKAALGGQVTLTPIHPAEIPDAGWADNVGLPVMLGLAGLLILVFFLARLARRSGAA